jgi:type VII secretion-associated serine protease mycosin
MGQRRLVAALGAVALVFVQGAAPASADQFRDDQWHLAALDIATAHQTAQGEGVTVAVIDSGVAVTADLDGNVLAGTDLIEGGTGDGRGDADGHGTAMTSLIAAHGHGPGGADGALGIAPAAKILPIRDSLENPDDPLAPIPDDQAEDHDQQMAAAIRWAVGHGARIISISEAWSSGAFEVAKAVDEAREADVLIFAAGGNLAQLDRNVPVPAALNWVVAVGATTPDGGHWEGGTTGSEVELSAPGVDVVSLGVDGSSRKGSGSSDSTAIVAGVAALVWSAYPGMSARDVLYRLEATATDAGAPGRDPEFGFGIVNPVGALTAELDPLRGSPPVEAPAGEGTTPPAGDDGGSGDEVAAPLDSGGGGLSDSVIVLVCAGLLAVLGVAALALRRTPATAGAGPGAPPMYPPFGPPVGMPPGPPRAPAPPPPAPAPAARRRWVTPLLAVAAVAVVVGGAVAITRSGDEAPSAGGTGGGGQQGGGGPVASDLPATPEAAVREFVNALKAQNCDRALELETESSWSRGGTLTREQGIANCQADATAYFAPGATMEEPERNDQSDDELWAVDVVDTSFYRHTLLISLAETDGGWQIDSSPADPAAPGYLYVITPDLAPLTPDNTIDTRIGIPAENATPPSCLNPTTANDFTFCYEDQADMFTN